MDRFDKQRRLLTLEYIQKYTIQNTKNLESSGDAFGRELQAIKPNPARTREYLLRVSMIVSLCRAEELGQSMLNDSKFGSPMSPEGLGRVKTNIFENREQVGLTGRRPFIRPDYALMATLRVLTPMILMTRVRL